MKLWVIPAWRLTVVATAGLLVLATAPSGLAAADSTRSAPLAGAHEEPTATAQLPEVPPAEGDTPQVDIETILEEARTLMNALEYEKAIAVLEPVLKVTRFEPERLRETYILLVEAHVYSGNHSPIGSKEQELWYGEARDLIRECLGVRELRHTQPDPPEDYPAEMLQLFEEVRREIFGSFEILKLQPAEAEVILDGEVLTAGESGIWLAVDVPVGSRMLVIRHRGYQSVTEDIDIGPATRVTRSYALQRNKGFRWYATRVAVPVVAVAGLTVGLLAGGDEQPASALQPLPAPPLPAER